MYIPVYICLIIKEKKKKNEKKYIKRKRQRKNIPEKSYSLSLGFLWALEGSCLKKEMRVLEGPLSSPGDGPSLEGPCLKKEMRVLEGPLSSPGDSPWIAPLSPDDVVGTAWRSGARRDDSGFTAAGL